MSRHRNVSLLPTLLVLGFFGQTALFAVPAVIQFDPQLPTTEDNISALIRGLVHPVVFAPLVNSEGDLEIGGTSSPSPSGSYAARVTLGQLPQGSYSVRVLVDGAEVARTPLRVEVPSDQLRLDDDSFAVVVTWFDSSGQPNVARAVQLSDQSGYFWFFQSTNIEITVKLLDARTINGHFWLFISSLTDVEFTLGIYSTPPCFSLPNPSFCKPLLSYSGRRGENANFIDIDSL